MIASVDNAAETMVVDALRQASNRPVNAQAVENCVPLIRPRPSFGPGVIPFKPASASAFAAEIRLPLKNASPSPIIAAAIWASGARSPDAPTEP